MGTATPQVLPQEHALSGHHCWRLAKARVESWHHRPPPRMLRGGGAARHNATKCSQTVAPPRCQPPGHSPAVGEAPRSSRPLVSQEDCSPPHLSSLVPEAHPALHRRGDKCVCVGWGGGGAGAALLREESICQASLVPESRALPPPRATAGCAGRSTAPCHSGDIWDSHRRRKQPPPRRLQHSPGQEERLPAGGPKPLPRPLHSIYNHHRFLKIPNIKK